MKFVVSSNTLLTRLQAVSKVIGGKPVQPILDNILLAGYRRCLICNSI